MVRVGVDTGGTFTDLVRLDAHGMAVHKVRSTPDDPARAILAGIAALMGVETVNEVIHGSTVATNAVLERKGARVALVTTKGFEDVLAIGRYRSIASMSGLHTHMSNTRNTPIEAIEHYLPLRIRSYALREGSGGAGEYPGGEGMRREYEMLTDTSVTLLTERRTSHPYGLQGGEPGGCGVNTVLRADGSVEAVPAKARLQLCAGDRLRIESPGGGGYGAT
jgi:N-methylhydantoinase B/oxoprolinase/acetone carboxylase alpha subunit